VEAGSETHVAGDARLLEREAELEALDSLLADAHRGRGRLMLIEGPAGIGKTGLLVAARERGAHSGLTVLTGSGGELERDFGFGVARQLFEPVLAAATEDERERLYGGAAALAEAVFAAAPAAGPPDSAPAPAILHGLFWLTVNLAERSPLLVSVDDIHWADEPSLRFLIYLARRLEGLHVAVAVARRIGEDTTHAELTTALGLQAPPPVIRPRPLGEGAAESLVKTRLGDDAGPMLCAACYEATAGNPFLLTELIDELRRDGRPPSEISPDVVKRRGSERIAAIILMRIGRRGRAAAALARAIAVLGVEARVEAAADLAGIDPASARSLASALAGAAILERGEPLGFVHPVVRTAIYEELPDSERSRLHGRAAAMLMELGSEPEVVAVHLLATAPAAEASAVSALREAAAAARARGAPEAASRYLERALREPPEDAEIGAVQLELGASKLEYGATDGRVHLRAAVRAATDPRAKARAVAALGWSTGPDPERQRELIPLYEEAAAGVAKEDRDLALRLEARRLEALLLLPDHTPSFEDEADRFRDLPGETAAECALLCFAGRKVMLGGGTARDVAEVVGRAAAHLDLSELGAHSVWLVTTILWLPATGGIQRRVEERLDEVIAVASRRGSQGVFAWDSTLRAFLRNLAGNLGGAEADARAALDSGGLAGPFPNAPVTPLIEALAEQGKTAEAEELLQEKGLAGVLPPPRPLTALLINRGRVRMVAGDIEAARADLEEALVRLERARSGGVSGLDARLELALIRNALGDEPGARELSDRALEAARAWGAERALGGALRVAGVLRGGEEGLALLREAVDALAESGAPIWHARAMVDLGAALRRAGQRSEAREPLAEAMDLAHRCGAVPLVDAAQEELTLTGARPRRILRTGVDALTPSEKRVAEMAASGMTNKAIAQALFVTLRTVEMHLTNAYGKLEISSRRELPEALADQASG
jgi:DNA-binding CsgD family transcriptional regulator